MSRPRRQALGEQGLWQVEEAARRFRVVEEAASTANSSKPERPERPEKHSKRKTKAEKATEAAAQLAEQRRLLREKVEAASQRPAPGSSDLLAGPVGGELRGVGGLGNPKTVTVHDLTSGGGTGGLAPIHLKRE